MHHIFIIITVCVACACIVAVSNKLTHHSSSDHDNKHFTNCFISHTIN